MKFTMNIDNLEYETIRNNKALPIDIYKKSSGKETPGCFFHWHENIELFFVKSGGVNLLCGGKQVCAKKNDLAIVNWCEPHRSISFLEDTVHYIIQIDLSSPVFSAVDFLKFTPPEIIKNNTYISSHLDKIIELYEDSWENYSLKIIGEMYCVLGEISGFSPKNTGFSRQDLVYTRRILQFIHENINSHINLSEISDLLGISSAYICRIFKVHTGKTIIQYCNLIKCDLAVSYIEKGHKISEVCSMVGFDDYNYFSRIFKKIMNCSPSSFKHNFEQ